MAFRKTISIGELRESRQSRGIDDSKYGSGNKPSRGGQDKSSKKEPGKDS